MSFNYKTYVAAVEESSCTISFFDIKTGGKIEGKTIRGISRLTRTLTYLRELECLACVSANGSVAVFKLEDEGIGEQIDFTFRGPKSGWGASADELYTGKKSILLVGCKDIELWDMEKEENRRYLCSLEGHRDEVRQVCSYVERNQLISGSEDKTMRIWDFEKEEELKKHDFGKPARGIDRIGETLYVALHNAPGLCSYDLRTYQIVQEAELSDDERLYCVKCFPGSNCVVGGGGYHNSNISVFDTRKLSTPVKKWRASNPGGYMHTFSICKTAEDEFYATTGARHLRKYNLSGEKLGGDNYINGDGCKVIHFGDLENEPSVLVSGDDELIDFFIEFEDFKKDLEIQTKSSVIKISSLFFSGGQSVIPDFSDDDLNIGEKDVIKVLMEEYQEDPMKLLDCYIFFRKLKLPDQINQILNQVSRIRDLSILLKMFQKTCELYENKGVKVLLTKKKLKPFEFDTSFAQEIHNSLVKRSKEINEMSDFVKLKNLSGENLEMQKVRKDHRDLKEMEKQKLIFSHLFGERGKGNVKVKVENVEMEAHLEVLVLKSNFFKSMIKFGGVELEEWRKEGTITVTICPKETMKNLIQYCYTESIQSGLNIEDLLELLDLSNMHFEEKLMEIVLNELERVGSEMNKDSDKRLDLEDAVIKKLNLFNTRKFRRYLPFDKRKYRELRRIWSLKKEINEVKKQNTELKLKFSKDIEEMRKRIEKLEGKKD